MKYFVLPGWTKRLPDNAGLRPKDLLPIFGYKTVNSLMGALYKNKVPLADRRTTSGKGRIGGLLWSMKYLRRLELEQGKAPVK